MLRAVLYAVVGGGLVPVVLLAGCRAAQPGPDTGAKRVAARQARLTPVRRVICLFEQRPWLNLDLAGDRDPEGIHYRVYLDTGENRGELRDGVFHVDMYRIDRTSLGDIERTLVSDWEYPTSEIQRVKSTYLGMGYHLQLRWAAKEIAGQEVEVITRYRDPAGRVIRSGTKRLRVPKYSS